MLISTEEPNLLLLVGFELSYEWFPLVVSVVNVFFGVLGGFYALRALMALYRSPEMLKTQRNIWLPILIGNSFFVFCGFLRFAEYSYLLSLVSSLEIDLLDEIFCAIGLSLITIGVIRYSQLQIEYYNLKREALREISKEHKQ